MPFPTHFISCDWGTTNFRLKVVEYNSLVVIAERKSASGIKQVYEQYLQQKRDTQQSFFTHFLEKQIRQLPTSFQAYPLVLSGMASSTIGMLELPYAPFPITKDGSSLLWKQLQLEYGNTLVLISGIKGDGGMMRGEEVQAIGIAELLPATASGTLILPGTHSKHISYSNQAFSSLTNFMTGELFEVLSTKSILANSVESGVLTTATEAAFRAGLQLGFNDQLSANLLMVRAKDVIHQTPKKENHYFLSGLLIGDELSYLKGTEDAIFLAAGNTIFQLYQMALTTLFDRNQLTFFDGAATEQALLIGQRKILKRSLDA